MQIATAIRAPGLLGKLDWSCSLDLLSWPAVWLDQSYILPNLISQPIRLTDYQAVMVLKYLVPAYPFPTLYFGVANVVANALIMLRHVLSIMVEEVNANIHSSSVVLWVSQNMEDDYTYNLAL